MLISNFTVIFLLITIYFEIGRRIVVLTLARLRAQRLLIVAQLVQIFASLDWLAILGQKPLILSFLGDQLLRIALKTSVIKIEFLLTDVDVPVHERQKIKFNGIQLFKRHAANLGNELITVKNVVVTLA